MPFKSFAFRLLFVSLIASVFLGGCSENDETDSDVNAKAFGKESGFTAVEIDPATSPAAKLAVQACAGLYNRQRGGSVYTPFRWQRLPMA